MTKNYPHIIPEIEQWPLNRIYSNRELFVKHLNQYTFDKFKSRSAEEISSIIADSIYQEKVRIKSNPWKVDPPNEKIYWRKIESDFKSNQQYDDKEERNKELLKKIIHRYSEEIAGNFNPKSFRFARKLLSFIFRRIFNKGKESGIFRPWGTKERLLEKIRTYGHIEEIRALAKKGTVVILPNHFSNLDSIIIGYMIDSKIGIPAYSYSAGLNLYDTELVAYLINRLGAYKTDRRKKNKIYLESLKTFSSLSLQKGLNSIFFPGGTRSRSGEFEKNIKYGLIGTMLEAQRNLSTSNSDNKIFIVPLFVGYHFVLEAKSLIDQYLSYQGKEKYLREKSSRSGIRQAFWLLRKMWKHDSELVMNFGKPMDVFGNEVDESGQSFDLNGNKINLIDYFKSNGEVTIDQQREYKYTTHLGKKVMQAFKTENVILSSHLVAHIAFSYVLYENPKIDFYDILNLPTKEFEINRSEFKRLISKALVFITQLEKENKLKLDEIFDASIEELIEDGIQKVGVYHRKKVLYSNKDMISSEDFKLLYFYHNRIRGYGIAKAVFEQDTFQVVNML